MGKRIVQFIKKEAVLSAACILAVISCFLVHPDSGYAEYIDFRTLAILFSLMTVMAGLRNQGVFDRLGKTLIGMSSSLFGVVLVLVLLCFFCSMIITNDVALITFVPFSFAVFDLIGKDVRRKWIIPVVCMQTIAANLGSMLTPLGNPQNLYLYGKSGMSMPAFLTLMLPYTAASLILLVGWALFLSSRSQKSKIAIKEADGSSESGNKALIIMYLVLFILCLTTVMRVTPYPAIFGIVLIAVAIVDRKTIGRVDYSLLLTFIGFFIFIGNLGRLPAFSNWLGSILNGREVIVSVLASQVISNVPAALLLSGFTEAIPSLIIGTNLGGLGTLIASMASLISYRQIAQGEPERKGEYFKLFTLSNIVFLVILMLLWLVIH